MLRNPAWLTAESPPPHLAQNPMLAAMRELVRGDLGLLFECVGLLEALGSGGNGRTTRATRGGSVSPAPDGRGIPPLTLDLDAPPEERLDVQVVPPPEDA